MVLSIYPIAVFLHMNHAIQNPWCRWDGNIIDRQKIGQGINNKVKLRNEWK